MVFNWKQIAPHFLFLFLLSVIISHFFILFAAVFILGKSPVMILLDSVTENVTSESLLEIFVIGLLVVKGNLLNVLCHKNDKMVPFLVDKRLELQEVL